MHRYNKQPIEIGRLQRFAMDAFYAKGAHLPPVAQNRQPHRIACVGGGPASLACAAELRRRGVAVTVFDDRPLPGGLNTYGVAEYKLRPADSLREVDHGAIAGRGVPPGGSGRRDAAGRTGARVRFPVPGAGAWAPWNVWAFRESRRSGVIDALRFIERYKTLPDFSVGKTVVVIGGGNTAIDAANAARAPGRREVHLFYRRTETRDAGIFLRVRPLESGRRAVPLAGAAGGDSGARRAARRPSGLCARCLASRMRVAGARPNRCPGRNSNSPATW